MSERLTGLICMVFDIKDQAGDDRVIIGPLPDAGIGGFDIISAHITLHAGFSADGSNHMVVSLQDAGTDGTGTDTIASRGGASVAWAADGVYDLTMASGNPYGIDAGDWIALNLDETGTVAYAGTLTVWAVAGQRGSA